MEPTSEQELKRLLDEGKISKAEYEQLLEAIHSTDQDGVKRHKTNRKKMQRLGLIWATVFFCFALGGMKLVHSNNFIFQVIYLIGIVLSAAFSAGYSLTAAFGK